MITIEISQQEVSQEYEEVDYEAVAEKIPWQEAGDHIGENLCVYGPVVNTYYDKEGEYDNQTFLAVGKDWEVPGRFIVVIEEGIRDDFPQPPEDYYMGKNIILCGEIVYYEDHPEMVIYDPDQIGIEEQTEGCNLTFDQGKIHEISQQFQDEGYHYFSLSYPDYWTVDEHYEMGYAVNFFSPLTTVFETNSGGTVNMPKYGMSIYILSDEIASMDRKTVADEFFSWWRDEVSVTEPDVYPEDPIYSYVIGDSEGNDWYLHYEFFEVGNDTFLFEVFGTGPEYEACMDYLVYSYLWDDERLYVDTEDTEEEKPKAQASAPTVTLNVIEGPTMVENMCYYRIKANVTGIPYPDISFNQDDSNGAWGSNIVQVNIYSEDESVTLTSTASNSSGSATDSITVTGCGGMIKKDEKPREEPEEEKEDEEEENHCPEIISIDHPTLVEPGEKYTLCWKARDIEDTGGDIVTKCETLCIPEDTPEGPFTITVEIFDSDGCTTTEVIEVTVSHIFRDP